MNQSEIAERAARELLAVAQDTYPLDEKLIGLFQARIERAIAESQAPREVQESLIALEGFGGDGEPSPKLAREIAEWFYGKEYAYLDHVISQIAAIIWRSGAAQEVSPLVNNIEIKKES